MDNRESSEIDFFSDAKTARLYVVDELLRSPQGGTYEEMLQKVDEWPDISRRAPGIPEGIVRLHLSFIHSNVHSVTIAYLEPSYKSRHRYGIARKKQRF